MPTPRLLLVHGGEHLGIQRTTHTMKITTVETIVVNMPMQLDGPVPMQGGQARTSIDMLLVRIDTDAGVTGWGEGFGHRIWPATRAAIDTLIGPLCVGRDATAIAALLEDLQHMLHGVGRTGPVMYALSAIDIALWDIAGKVAQLPLIAYSAVPRVRTCRRMPVCCVIMSQPQ